MQLKSILLYVPDVPAAAAFYEAAFGLKVTMQTPDGQYAQMDSGETAIGFGAESAIKTLGLPMMTASANENAAPTQLAFETEDVEEAFTKVVAAGGTIINPPTARPWGQVVGHVRDLNGFVIEIGSIQAGEWNENA